MNRKEAQCILRRPPPLIKIPKFKGDNDPDIYLEWEQNIDQIFNVHQVGSKNKWT